MAQCLTCAHWIGDKIDRRKKVRFGECIAAKCYLDFIVKAPPWCSECDPYGMNEATLRTREDFTCKHWAVRGDR